MNLDSLSFALSQISYSVANLTRKNYKSSVVEINHLISQHGAEADRHLYRCLFSLIDFNSDGKTNGKDFHQAQYLNQECPQLITKPDFVSTLCYSVDHPLQHQKSLKPSVHLVGQISKVLKLTKSQEVVFAFALLKSVHEETRQSAKQFLKSKLSLLLTSYIQSADSSSGAGFQDIAIEVLHLLLTHLAKSYSQFGLTYEQKEEFFEALRIDFPRKRVPVILAPLLYSKEDDIPSEKLTPDLINMPNSLMDGSMADMIHEIGFVFTSSVEECRNNLHQFSSREINPASVARVLAMMINNPTGLGDSLSIQSMNKLNTWNDNKDRLDQRPHTWSIDVFVQALRDLVPHLNWREVVGELDHPGFMVPSKQGLRLLINALFWGLNHLKEPFPVNLIYKQWKNTEGQLSFISHALANVDVFCFADHQRHPVVLDALKTHPDDDNRDISNWRCLELIELLLKLSDAGHYSMVSELFKFPANNCPDVLVLALLQILTIRNTLKNELLSRMIPIFLGNHANSLSLLNYAWHCPNHSTTIRQIIMQSMAEWYMRDEQNDQSRLNRILEVAQDLKALSMLLNSKPFAFVIDLACLASRRTYLKLEMWIADKWKDHQDSFVQAIVNFLRKRCPQLVSGVNKDDPPPDSRSLYLPADTLDIMIKFLNHVSSQNWDGDQETRELMITILSNGHILLNKLRHHSATASKPPPPPIGMPSSSTTSSAVNNIENLGLGATNNSAPFSLASGSNFSTSFSTSNSLVSTFPPPISSAGPASLTSDFPPATMGLAAGISNIFPPSTSSSGFPSSALNNLNNTFSNNGNQILGGPSGFSQVTSAVGATSGGFPSLQSISSAFSSGASFFPSASSTLSNLSANSLQFSSGGAAGGFQSTGSTPYPPLSSSSNLGNMFSNNPLTSSSFPNISSAFQSAGMNGGPSNALAGGLANGLAGSLQAGLMSGFSTSSLSNGLSAGLNSGFGSSGAGPFGNSNYPLGLSSLGSTGPGSPAKCLANFNPSPSTVQSLGSQFQGLSLTSSLNASLARNSALNTLSAGANLARPGAASGLNIGSQGVGNINLDRLGLNKPGGGASGALGQTLERSGVFDNAGAVTSGNTAPSSDMSSLFPAQGQQFSREIEDEANSYFQRIYSQHPSMSIDEVLEMLKRFRDSPVRKEKEIFACMLRNLFEEYRYFPQYPDRELNTTALLFGGIVEQGIVTYVELRIALRYVLDALKKPFDSKMYLFGIAALDRFRNRLKDYQQYCQHLASIPHFSQFPAHLKECVEYAVLSSDPGNRSLVHIPTPSNAPVSSALTTVVPTTTTDTVTTSTEASSAETSTTSTSITTTTATSRRSEPSIAVATNIDTLIAGQENQTEEIAVPPESVQDKVFFIFNNLSRSNKEQKAAELKEQITEEYYTWVAQYLVMKRASIEPNFHGLYASFIDMLKTNEITLRVIKETYRNIKVLLRSDKGVANFSDRSLLKNLGHWLGMLTLAKNKPILHIDIDLKSLLYEAYHKGAQELLYVVPFVAKILESTAKCKVFKPPNPWTMALMNVLAELHQERSLKLNLKFEIEVLCKTLSLDVKDIKPSNYLNDRERLATLEHQLSAPKQPTELVPAAANSTPVPAEDSLVSALPQSSLPPPSNSSALPGGSAKDNVLAGLTGASHSSTGPPMPKYSYQDINVMSIAGLSSHIVINDQLALFQAHPQLKSSVQAAIENATQELLVQVVERSIKIAITTCEQIVKKDFALDPEESRMRTAAHHMVHNMAAGMALITCREPLLISISTHLKNNFLSQLMGATPQQKEQIEIAASVITQDNVELACAFMQKTAIEKAIPEMDKRLTHDFELRKMARNEGRRYCDPTVLTYQAERMPEQIRLKVGGVTPHQFNVYEEFMRRTPGFLPSVAATDPLAAAFSKQTPGGSVTSAGMASAAAGNGSGFARSSAADDLTHIYERVARDIEQSTHACASPPSHPLVLGLHALHEAVVVARNARGDVTVAAALLQKAVEGLLEALTSSPTDTDTMLRFRDCHLLVLRGLQDQRAYGPQWTNKYVTRILTEACEEARYNVEAIECLIRSHLVSLQQYDLFLAQAMDNGHNLLAVHCAMQLVQRLCLSPMNAGDDKAAAMSAKVNETEFSNTIEMFVRICQHSRTPPDGLLALVNALRQQRNWALLEQQTSSTGAGPTSMMHSGLTQAREFDDPPGLHNKTEYLLREWVNMYHSPGAGRDSSRAFSAFVTQMHQQGILKTDDLITRFFRLCTEMCVDLCYKLLSGDAQGPTMMRSKCFYTLDAFVRLIALLVKHSGDTSNTVTKINLLNKVLGIVAGVLLQDHEVRNTEFQQLPYHRIFIMLFIELNAPEHVLESINFQVLTAFCNTFHVLRPSIAPGFSYAWLELVSHRVFIGRMLAITPQQKGWNMYAQLLIDLFKFLSPFLRNAELTKPTQLLYKGSLRVLLVLLHDFPEFLCDYHYAFCDVVPPNCIQMRNLILSAFPRNMRLPDPFTPNLKVDMLPEITQAPRIMTSFGAMIEPQSFKDDLDSYLKSRSQVVFLSELRSTLQKSKESGMRYNIALMNALVLYVGTQAIAYIQSKGLAPNMSTIAHSSHMDIFQNLAVDLDTEGRYLFLNAIANQLRYPNSHTHYFSCTLLYLFAEANTEAIQEQITRVLLERLIVNRPHPWGLLITFIELIKNSQFKFWNHEFVHCAPEIKKLFDSVARSCMPPKQQTNVLREGESTEVH